MDNPYMIIHSDDGISSLAEKVWRKIHEGWQPLGGVAVSEHGCFQAMIWPKQGVESIVERQPGKPPFGRQSLPRT